MPRYFLLFIVISCPFFLTAQTFSIAAETKPWFSKQHDKRAFVLFHSLSFRINGQVFKATDTVAVEFPIRHHDFDTVLYSYTTPKGQVVQDSFITKFRVGEQYFLRPCTCCGFFMISHKHYKRGWVRFDNPSTLSYVAMASDFDYENIPPNTTTAPVFSSISMNCGARPNLIFIAQPSYLDAQFLYKKGDSHKEAQRKENARQKKVLYRFNYLFLHEEELSITIQENGVDCTVEIVEKNASSLGR